MVVLLQNLIRVSGLILKD